MTATTRPVRTTTPAQWLRKNLFRTPLDSVLTLILAPLSLYALYLAARFVFVTGRWEIVEVNLKLLMVGNWPIDHMARISVTLVAFGFLGGIVAGLVHARQVRRGTASVLNMSRRERILDLARRFGLILFTVLLLLALTSTWGPTITAVGVVVAGVAGRVVGGILGRLHLPKPVAIVLVLLMLSTPFLLYFYLVDAVPLARWEGFWFNLSSAAAGIILCFPLGVLIAIGRRSKLPLIRGMSTIYVELVRGVPFFVLLLMAHVALEFFVPASIAPSRPVRAIVVFTIFTAAYLAEIVRGGLQSVPRGQEEAARAVGLSPFSVMSRIVLPQALRNVIPAQIGQFISLFKDTVLAGLAMSIFDMAQVASAITQQSAFRGQGLIVETLTFTAFLFWVGAYTMSRESQRLERKLGVGTR
ncbi:MAG: amino acid ABC transporter permease [Acidimicrobiales bacterium]|jgi:general L-amino acid transport system permease protein|nr:amino acid ABC transporter permease [Acidimicrobiales bacterium]